MFPLRVSDIQINIKSKRLIGPINLQIEQNGISILLGANGSGKTTLLEALHGLRKLSAGKNGHATLFLTMHINRQSSSIWP